MSPITQANVYLGAAKQPCSIDSLIKQHGTESAFVNFHRNLVSFISVELGIDAAELIQPTMQVCSCSDLNSKRLTCQIVEYRFLKVSYESKETCKMEQDYLQCSPQYHNRTRYDTVLVNTANSPMFAELRFVFAVSLNEHVYLLALVQAYV